ncbi:MAG: hypothetical protein ACRBBP_01320 [Bdellovibrionales bacterium]
MKKKLVLLSASFFSVLVYFSEYSGTQAPLNSPQTPTEHNILLDLSSETDKVIYDNLIYSNYNCSLLNPKQAQCTQFTTEGEVIASNGTAVELYKYKSNSGQALKIYQLANGEAHIEFRVKSTETLYRYSFTSLDQIPLFAGEKGLFITGSVEWDISSLDHIL